MHIEEYNLSDFTSGLDELRLKGEIRENYDTISANVKGVYRNKALNKVYVEFDTSPDKPSLGTVVDAHGGFVKSPKAVWRLVQAVKIGAGVKDVTGGGWVEVDCIISDPHKLTPNASNRMGQVRCQIRSNGETNVRLTEDGNVIGSALVASTGDLWEEVLLYSATPTPGSHAYCIDFDAGVTSNAEVRGCSLAILER